MTYHSYKTGTSIHFVIYGVLLLTLLIGCGDGEEEIIPPAPKGLGHTLTKGKISLNWEAAEHAETYRIYRGTQLDGDFQVIGSTNKLIYDDTQVTAGNTYIYKVAGVSDDGVEGKPSAPYQVPYQEGALQVPQDAIDFGESIIHHDLKLKNIGGLTLRWTLETRENWISLDPKEGDLNPQGEQVVRIAIERGDDPGEYKGTVLIKTDTDETIQIPVRMDVAAEPRIAIDPTEITFEGVGQAHRLTIQNAGTGILEWNIQNVPNWLALDDTQGETSTSSSRIQLTIEDTEQLQSDRAYTATLNVVSNDASNPKLTVNIILNVPPLPPKLDILDTDKHLIFSSKESTRSITVRNVGGGAMTWRAQAESAAAWLKIDPQQGEINPNSSDPLTFTADREQGIPGKTLKATVTIDAGDAGTQPIVIEVAVPGESWVVSPESLTLDDSATENIMIGNNGEERLHWSASSQEFWIKLSDKNGEIESGKTHSLRVSVDTTSLTLGSHVGEIQLTTKGGKQVSVRVQTVKEGSITGAALDSRSGAPVRDILISLDGKTPENYRTGDFQIERAIPGAFQLRAEREEYLPATFNGTLDNRGNAAPVEMWMRPIPHVVGTIEDPAKPLGSPMDICLSGDGTRAYVSDEFGSVSVIDVTTDAVMDQIQVGIHPMGIAAHPRNDEVYVADAEAHQVLVLDVRSRKVTNRVEVDRYPQQLAISQDGSQLYVTCRDSGSVVLIDTGRHQKELSFFVGREPYGIALSPDGGTLYVANSGDNSVSITDTAGRSLETIQVASRPQHLAVSKDRVYVSNSFGDRVSAIDQAARRLVEHIEMGKGLLLSDLAVLEEPKGGDVIYVIDQTSSALRLIDSVTRELIDEEIRVGDIPTALAITPDLTKIYVVNSGSANISVLGF